MWKAISKIEAIRGGSKGASRGPSPP